MKTSILVLAVALCAGASVHAKDATQQTPGWGFRPGKALASLWNYVVPAVAEPAPVESDKTTGEAQMDGMRRWEEEEFIVSHPALSGLIAELDVYIQGNFQFKKLLEDSIIEAKVEAAEDLDPDLYSHLTWPETIAVYLDYLADFGVYTPVEASQTYWIQPGTESHQEVYDRLAHFYWLVKFENETTDERPQDDTFFANWLVEFAVAWGDHLNDPVSFNETILQGFIDNSPSYEIWASMIGGRPNQASGWQTFNQFFSRRLNPGQRWIKDMTNNTVITSACDCFYVDTLDISITGTIPPITIKGTHEYETVADLIGDNSAYVGDFDSGYLMHYTLPLYAYHRIHSPVDGMVLENYNMEGYTYMGIKIHRTDGYFKTQVYAFNGFEFRQQRAVTIIDTANSPYGDVGTVAVVSIGLGHIGSINPTHENNTWTRKGDELAYFAFGGSDLIILFQDDAVIKVNSTDTLIRVGNQIANAIGASHP